MLAPISARGKSSRKQLNFSKVYDYNKAVILSHMHVGAQEVLSISKELGKKLVTGDALMDYFKRPYTSILTKDMFKFLFKNIELMAAELSSGGQVE